MKANPNTKSNELVSCEICLKEVPSDQSHVSEIDDYVMNFCGLECLDKWHKQAEKAQKSNSG